PSCRLQGRGRRLGVRIRHPSARVLRRDCGVDRHNGRMVGEPSVQRRLILSGLRSGTGLGMPGLEMPETAQQRVFLVVVDESEEEPSMSILVLAAGTGPEGPGPLISYLTGKPAARLRIPITIVPGGATMEQLDSVS